MGRQRGYLVSPLAVVLFFLLTEVCYGNDVNTIFVKRYPAGRILPALNRLVKWEPTNHNDYQYSYMHLQLMNPRQKRSWVGDDPGNRATEIGTTSTPTPPMTPPEAQTTSIIPTTPTQGTTSSSPPTTTTIQQTSSAEETTATSQETTMSTGQSTNSSTSTVNTTTQSSSTSVLPNLYRHVVVALVLIFVVCYYN